MKKTLINALTLLTVAAPQASAAGLPVNESGEKEPPETVIAVSPDKSAISDTSRVFDLDEVVIVSQPKEVLRLRQQPLSSSILTGREISSLGIRDLCDLSGHIPSFSMPAYGSRLTSSMYIRGIGSRVNNPAIGIYTDGIPLVSKNSFNFHTYQLERADILRGPQGTLYGMNTEGGLIRMYSKNPMKYQGTDIKLGTGTHFYRNIEAAHYHKAGSRLAFSIAGFYNGQNGFFKNITTGNRADLQNEAGGKTRITGRLTDNFTADFTADYQYMRQNAFPYGLFDRATGDVAAPSANRQNRYTRNMLNTGLNLKYVTERLTLNSTTSYQYLNDCMTMDQDYLPQDYMHLSQRQLMNALTQELTVKNNTNGSWRRMSGVYGSCQWLKTGAPVSFDTDFTSRISGGIQPVIYSSILKAMTDRMTASGMPQAAAEQAAAAAIEKAGGITVNTEMQVPGLFHTPQLNIGVFHESYINITPRLTATLGLRYDYNLVRVNYDTYAAMALTVNVMGSESTNTLRSMLRGKSRDSYSQLLPKIGLSWHIADNGSNIYATVCKGYRAGGYNIQMFSDILQAELNENSGKAMAVSYDVPHTAGDYERINNTISYKPEESWNYEAGAHLNLFGNMLHADFSAYYMQIRNQQLSVMAAGYGFGRMMVNAGKSRSCGIEASLRGSALNDRLSWAASYGVTHATFKEYKEKAEDGTETDYRDKKVPFIPRHTLSLRAEYRLPLNFHSINSLTIGADMTAQGRTYWDEANTCSQPFYALLGTHATLTAGNDMSLRLWCRNITGTHYNTFAFSSAASGQTVWLAQKGNPIQAGIDIQLHF